MMSILEINPALAWFLASFDTERSLAQVLIHRVNVGFELRHEADQARLADELKPVPLSELRKLATFNTAGQFRPLHAAPDLVAGWICRCKDENELWSALQDLYPGAIPDLYASHRGFPVTDYRMFTGRQTGMYRISQLLSDSQAADVIRACCAARFCLKRRLWSVPGLETDQAEAKSAIPCLEPCAVLLELARKAARIEQEDKLPVQLSRSDLQSLLGAAKALIEGGTERERVGNIGSPTNLRRLQLVLEKFAKAAELTEACEED